MPPNPKLFSFIKKLLKIVGYIVLALMVVFMILVSLCIVAHGATVKQQPEPTLVMPDNTTVFVLFKFGAWVRVAYNNSQAVAPIMVYAYSRTGLPVEFYDNYNHTASAQWGLALNVSKLDVNKPYKLIVKYRGETYTLNFKIVKEIKEKERPTGVVSLDKFKEFLDKEAQYAAFLAAVAIAAAVAVKRKTLLLRTFNILNILIVSSFGSLIWIVAPRAEHSQWLAAPFTLSYLIAYSAVPAGRKVYLIKIIPSLRKVLWERAILYRTAEGMLAYAKQSVTEAFKRILGSHIILKDAELNRLGEISNDKFWTVEDVEFYEKSEGLLVIDAQLTKERIPGKTNEVSLYE
ncbi:MAG: hypothetical protein F7C38_06860 [Desulfurococcales archaeon]|nr:hypothetical protein [Desulfurococcales archaeon]